MTRTISARALLYTLTTRFHRCNSHGLASRIAGCRRLVNFSGRPRTGGPDHFAGGRTDQPQGRPHRALEEGDYGVFAAAVYAKGSMRTYAKLLRLDPVATVEQMSARDGADTHTVIA
ncbi:MAG: hypothetical protein HC841_07225, partial [Verrucomicrobiae bacterium]|nr:hypothetical protein [Verrucomicrobiae bacterium]